MKPLLATAAVLAGFLLSAPTAPSVSQLSDWTGAALLAVEHVDFVVVRVSDKAYTSSGTLTGKLLSNLVGAQGGPSLNLDYVCTASAEISDLKSGIIRNKTGDCAFRDRDGDTIYTTSQCSLRSRDDWCGGRITGGTGKYSGIAGTIRHRNPGPGKFMRTCLESPAAAECEATYATAAAVPVGARYRIVGDWAVPHEWEWRME